jgi:hypothetical protein
MYGFIGSLIIIQQVKEFKSVILFWKKSEKKKNKNLNKNENTLYSRIYQTTYKISQSIISLDANSRKFWILNFVENSTRFDEMFRQKILLPSVYVLSSEIGHRFLGCFVFCHFRLPNELVSNLN